MKAAMLIVRRFGAFALDWLVFGIGSLPIVLVFWFGGVDETAEARIQTILLWAWLIYFAVFEWTYGATVGKFLFRLTVKRTDGTRLSLLSAVSRTGLTFVVPCVLSIFIIPGILLLNSSNLAEHIAMVVSTAILAVIPLSIIIFEGQSAADVLLRTCVIPVTAVAKTPVAATARRWVLIGLFSLLVGVGFAWTITAVHRMMYRTTDMNEASRKFVSTFPADLIAGGRLAPSERNMMLDFRGNFIRQPKRQGADRKDLFINLYGSATSYDELLALKLVAFHMAELPDAERPKCITVKFIKEFEGVLTSFEQEHEMMVCDVPKGLPYQATVIDHNLGVSWRFKLDPADMLTFLTGQSGSPIKRFVPGTRKLGHLSPTNP